MKSQVLLFTNPTCPNCPMAKKLVQEFKKERKDATFKEYNTHTPEGMRIAKEFEIRAVPTFIIRGEGYEKNIGFVGTPTTKKLNELINLSQGKKSEKKKFGLFR